MQNKVTLLIGNINCDIKIPNLSIKKKKISHSNFHNRKKTVDTHSNVTLAQFVLTFLTWKNSDLLHILSCVCSLSDPAWNAHAPYRHLWPVWLYHIFPHYHTICTIFGRNVTAHKLYVLISSTDLSEIFFFLRRIERDTIKNVYIFVCSAHENPYHNLLHTSYNSLFRDSYWQSILSRDLRMSGLNLIYLK